MILLRPPLAHQAPLIEKIHDSCVSHGGCLVEVKMSGGKSYMACATIHKIWNEDPSPKTLIVSPVGAMGVWRYELGENLGINPDIMPVSKPGPRRAQFLCEGSSSFKVVSWDSFRSKEISAWAKSEEWDFVILDESHFMKSPKSLRFKEISALKARHRICLSGTPATATPMDYWTQVRWVSHNSILHDRFTSFRDRYCETEGVRGKPSYIKVIKSFKDLDHLHKEISPVICRYEGELDLPEFTELSLSAHLDSREDGLYRKMIKESALELEEGDAEALSIVSKIMKLKCMCSGFVKIEDDYVSVNQAKERALEEWLDCLSSDQFPLIIFFYFKYSALRVRSICEKRGLRVGELSGSVKDCLDDSARLKEGIDVALVQFKSGGAGIDLSRSNTGMFYDVTDDWASSEQAKSRLVRTSQERPVSLTVLTVDEGIDKEIYYGLLKSKGDLLRIFESGNAGPQIHKLFTISQKYRGK